KDSLYLARACVCERACVCDGPFFLVSLQTHICSKMLLPLKLVHLFLLRVDSSADLRPGAPLKTPDCTALLDRKDKFNPTSVQRTPGPVRTSPQWELTLNPQQ
ncbi:hypothetical protein SRHO_G00009300, partial [Serrasalmus rhombeus]